MASCGVQMGVCGVDPSRVWGKARGRIRGIKAHEAGRHFIVKHQLFASVIQFMMIFKRWISHLNDKGLFPCVTAISDEEANLTAYVLSVG